MNFSIPQSIQILERTPAVLCEMLHDLSPEWVMKNEGNNTWSPYDVVGHLVYAERVNWIQRADVILSDLHDKTFATFDRFAQFEESKGKKINHLLDEFAQLRKENISKLMAFKLNKKDLNKTGRHPAFGEVTLSQLLATWTVHDLDHIAQISRVMSKQYSDAVGSWVNFLRILQ